MQVMVRRKTRKRLKKAADKKERRVKARFKAKARPTPPAATERPQIDDLEVPQLPDPPKHRKTAICLMTHLTVEARDKAEAIRKKERSATLSDAIMDALDHYHAILFGDDTST